LHIGAGADHHKALNLSEELYEQAVLNQREALWGATICFLPERASRTLSLPVKTGMQVST
jgi:hypothetical protein